MGYLHQPATAGADHAPAGASPAAGKRTLTQGIPLVEQGTRCDREPELEGCVRDPQHRAYLITVLSHVVGTAMDNCRDAIQDQRIELLTTTEEGWTMLDEFLFALSRGPVVDIAVSAAMRAFGKAAARMAEGNGHRLALLLAKAGAAKETIKGVVVAAATGIRTALKGLAGSAGHQGKAIFLQIVRAQIQTISNHLIMKAPVGLDDLELEALTMGYADEEAHSVAAYASLVADLLSRYDQNRIDDIGRTQVKGKRIGQDWGEEEIHTGELVWTTAGGVRRLALLRGREGAMRFQLFIEPQFLQLALQLYQARTGRAPAEQDLDDADQRQACMWGEGAWLELITRCDAPGGA